MPQDINLQNFHFNPFAGLMDREIDSIIQPTNNCEHLAEKILASKGGIFEFLGKQGRGKTTHLKWIHSLIPNSEIHYLNQGDIDSLKTIPEHKILFVDSIHHLSLRKRIALFKSNNTLIYTTHWTRKWEVKLAGKKVKTIHFKGIDTHSLHTILNKRIDFAANNSLPQTAYFSPIECESLISKHGDNIRAIITQLYYEYQ